MNEHVTNELIDCFKTVIAIVTNTEDEMFEVREKIYQQLVGNPDYVNNNIILNGSDDRLDGSVNTVCVYISEECKNIPSITI